MTRFTRANNAAKKKPEDATPWKEMVKDFKDVGTDDDDDEGPDQTPQIRTTPDGTSKKTEPQCGSVKKLPRENLCTLKTTPPYKTRRIQALLAKASDSNMALKGPASPKPSSSRDMTPSLTSTSRDKPNESLNASGVGVTKLPVSTKKENLQTPVNSKGRVKPAFSPSGDEMGLIANKKSSKGRRCGQMMLRNRQNILQKCLPEHSGTLEAETNGNLPLNVDRAVPGRKPSEQNLLNISKTDLAMNGDQNDKIGDFSDSSQKEPAGKSIDGTLHSSTQACSGTESRVGCQTPLTKLDSSLQHGGESSKSLVNSTDAAKAHQKNNTFKLDAVSNVNTELFPDKASYENTHEDSSVGPNENRSHKITFSPGQCQSINQRDIIEFEDEPKIVLAKSESRDLQNAGNLKTDGSSITPDGNALQGNTPIAVTASQSSDGSQSDDSSSADSENYSDSGEDTNDRLLEKTETNNTLSPHRRNLDESKSECEPKMSNFSLNTDADGKRKAAGGSEKKSPSPQKGSFQIPTRMGTNGKTKCRLFSRDGVDDEDDEEEENDSDDFNEDDEEEENDSDDFNEDEEEVENDSDDCNEDEEEEVENDSDDFNEDEEEEEVENNSDDFNKDDDDHGDKQLDENDHDSEEDDSDNLDDDSIHDNSFEDDNDDDKNANNKSSALQEKRLNNISVLSTHDKTEIINVQLLGMDAKDSSVKKTAATKQTVQSPLKIANAQRSENQPIRQSLSDINKVMSERKDEDLEGDQSKMKSASNTSPQNMILENSNVSRIGAEIIGNNDEVQATKLNVASPVKITANKTQAIVESKLNSTAVTSKIQDGIQLKCINICKNPSKIKDNPEDGDDDDLKDGDEDDDPEDECDPGDHDSDLYDGVVYKNKKIESNKIPLQKKTLENENNSKTAANANIDKGQMDAKECSANKKKVQIPEKLFANKSQVAVKSEFKGAVVTDKNDCEPSWGIISKKTSKEKDDFENDDESDDEDHILEGDSLEDKSEGDRDDDKDLKDGEIPTIKIASNISPQKNKFNNDSASEAAAKAKLVGAFPVAKALSSISKGMSKEKDDPEDDDNDEDEEEEDDEDEEEEDDEDEEEEDDEDEEEEDDEDEEEEEDEDEEEEEDDDEEDEDGDSEDEEDNALEYDDEDLDNDNDSKVKITGNRNSSQNKKLVNENAARAIAKTNIVKAQLNAKERISNKVVPNEKNVQTPSKTAATKAQVTVKSEFKSAAVIGKNQNGKQSLDSANKEPSKRKGDLENDESNDDDYSLEDDDNKVLKDGDDPSIKIASNNSPHKKNPEIDSATEAAAKAKVNDAQPDAQGNKAFKAEATKLTVQSCIKETTKMQAVTGKTRDVKQDLASNSKDMSKKNGDLEEEDNSLEDDDYINEDDVDDDTDDLDDDDPKFANASSKNSPQNKKLENKNAARVIIKTKIVRAQLGAKECSTNKLGVNKKNVQIPIKTNTNKPQVAVKSQLKRVVVTSKNKDGKPSFTTINKDPSKRKYCNLKDDVDYDNNESFDDDSDFPNITNSTNKALFMLKRSLDKIDPRADPNLKVIIANATKNTKGSIARVFDANKQNVQNPMKVTTNKAEEIARSESRKNAVSDKSQQSKPLLAILNKITSKKKVADDDDDSDDDFDDEDELDDDDSDDDLDENDDLDEEDELDDDGGDELEDDSDAVDDLKVKSDCEKVSALKRKIDKIKTRAGPKPNVVKAHAGKDAKGNSAIKFGIAKNAQNVKEITSNEAQAVVRSQCKNTSFTNKNQENMPSLIRIDKNASKSIGDDHDSDDEDDDSDDEDEDSDEDDDTDDGDEDDDTDGDDGHDLEDDDSDDTLEDGNYFKIKNMSNKFPSQKRKLDETRAITGPKPKVVKAHANNDAKGNSTNNFGSSKNLPNFQKITSNKAQAIVKSQCKNTSVTNKKPSLVRINKNVPKSVDSDESNSDDDVDEDIDDSSYSKIKSTSNKFPPSRKRKLDVDEKARAKVVKAHTGQNVEGHIASKVDPTVHYVQNSVEMTLKKTEDLTKANLKNSSVAFTNKKDKLSLVRIKQNVPKGRMPLNGPQKSATKKTSEIKIEQESSSNVEGGDASNEENHHFTIDRKGNRSGYAKSVPRLFSFSANTKGGNAQSRPKMVKNEGSRAQPPPPPRSFGPGDKNKPQINRGPLICFACREEGHRMTNCPKAQKSSCCYNCGSTEHFARNCKQKFSGLMPFAKCFKCQKPGHVVRNCPENMNGVFPNGGKCHHCNSNQHKHYECPTMKKGKKRGAVAAVFARHTTYNMSADHQEEAVSTKMNINLGKSKIVKFG